MSGRKLEDAKLGLATGITLLFWASAFVAGLLVPLFLGG